MRRAWRAIGPEKKSRIFHNNDRLGTGGLLHWVTLARRDACVIEHEAHFEFFTTGGVGYRFFGFASRYQAI